MRYLDHEDKVLEIGCGRGELGRTMRALGIDWTCGDPATGTVSAEEFYDAIVSIDVMEHLTMNEVHSTMHMATPMARKHVWSIANMSDVHIVNGEEVELHTTQRPPEWWEAVAALYWRGRIRVEEINCHRFWLILDMP
jgi:2-polyprenyl-3-methyl-5-hydroxy-6-metoxy-1,4-benzoquinol methylase